MLALLTHRLRDAVYVIVCVPVCAVVNVAVLLQSLWGCQ